MKELNYFICSHAFQWNELIQPQIIGFLKLKYLSRNFWHKISQRDKYSLLSCLSALSNRLNCRDFVR